MYETIIVNKEAGMGQIIFNRPDKYNAFNNEMLEETRQALEMLEKDEDVRVITLEGTGKAFSTGQDLAGVDDSMNHGEVIRLFYAPLVQAIDTSEKLIVAKVNGIAAGAGMSIALACDMRWMSDDAMMTSAFINVGLVPDSGHIFYLTKLAGQQKALEISMFSPRMGAGESLDLGLVDDVFAKDIFDTETRKRIGRLLGKPSIAIGLIKQLTKRAADSTLPEFMDIESEYQRVSGLTEDHREGMMAFREKRKAEFKGK
ncbi:enoyl-CoA hydratase/isomerase family protein [Salinicoccus carnicancri]|uniref:enoyl-CoA hydratase/isomerase family protein n=1 Tax=Salinicoccus carnicancri TaxID=558170 RepID=UPI0002D55B44|nr:enoyl-CoA hydratase-related protein [Salinicoccus carnicancri]